MTELDPKSIFTNNHVVARENAADYLIEARAEWGGLVRLNIDGYLLIPKEHPAAQIALAMLNDPHRE